MLVVVVVVEVVLRVRRLVVLVMVLVTLGTNRRRGQGRRVAQRGVRGGLATLLLYNVRDLVEESPAEVGAAAGAVALTGHSFWLGHPPIVAHGPLVRGHSSRLGSGLEPVQGGEGWCRGGWRG